MLERRAAVVSLATAVLLFGCGDDAAPPDAPPCTLVPAAGYGTLSFASTHAGRLGNGTVAWLGTLQGGMTSDVLDIQLVAGNTVWAAGPPAPGTFALTGAEAQLMTCGVCVVLQVNVPRQYFVAQGGTLVVDEVGPTGTGKFRATLTDATFAHVMVDLATSRSTVVDDGCTTSITSASWETTITSN